MHVYKDNSIQDTVPATLNPSQHSWLQTPGLIRIFDAITSGGGEARVVGGAVRDALLGREVREVDLACTLPPEKTTSLLEAAGLKVVPTGIAHGTVTAVADHVGYEVTTLRRDVETDGRRAKVEFTDDWQADAARRDFTINALYADADGKLYDYFNGAADIAEGRVRFIGDAEARIREDVLRILRFFRFTACFVKGEPDAAALAACRNLAHLIPTLSVERIWREISKLLAAPNPVPAWKLMKDAGVLAHMLPQALGFARLEGLLEAEKKYQRAADPLIRLAALLPQDKNLAIEVAQKLKLSNRETEKLLALAAIPAVLELDAKAFRIALYEFGVENATASALLCAASDQHPDIAPALNAAAAWENPTFPLQGEDLLKLGLIPGPKVGEHLRKLEDWWIGSDFKASREACLAEAKRRIG